MTYKCFLILFGFMLSSFQFLVSDITLEQEEYAPSYKNYDFLLNPNQKKTLESRLLSFNASESIELFKPQEEIDIEFTSNFIPLNPQMKQILNSSDEDTIIQIRTILERCCLKSLDDQIVIIKQLSQPKFFAPLINAMIENPKQLEKITKKSYYHHNGFDKLVLMEGEDFTLRLHIWWKENRGISQENIHNHRWDFVSSILIGTMEQDFFQLLDKPPLLTDAKKSNFQELNHYLYLPYKDKTTSLIPFFVKNKSRYQMKYLGNSFLKHKMKIKLPAGYSYRLKRKELHRVTVDYHETVATLMIYTKPYGKSSEVFSEVNQEFFIKKDDQAVKVEAFSQAQVVQKLNALLELLPENTNEIRSI